MGTDHLHFIFAQAAQIWQSPFPTWTIAGTSRDEGCSAPRRKWRRHLETLGVGLLARVQALSLAISKGPVEDLIRAVRLEVKQIVDRIA
jgi:hypothetical protein